MKIKLFATLLLFLSVASLTVFQVPISESSEVHDVAVTDVKVFPTWVVPAMNVLINAIIENQGTSMETFNVTAYFDSYTIQTFTIIDMAASSNVTITFEWSIYPDRFSIFSKSWPQIVPVDVNVIIGVGAEVVAGETDTSDNVYIDGTVTVFWMAVDYDGNGKVDIRDVARVAIAYGSYPGHPLWDRGADIDQNGELDMRDIASVARMFGAVYA